MASCSILYNNFVNNQFSLKFNDYIHENLVQTILDSKLWNNYYFDTIIISILFIKIWRHCILSRKGDFSSKIDLKIGFIFKNAVIY